jgi:hypothetical protein
MFSSGTFTAVGSWPHTDVQKITRLITDNFKDLPAWPQLPNLHFYENMYVQYSQGLPCIVLDEENRKIHFHTGNDIFSSIHTVYENFLSGNYDYFAISEPYAAGLYAFQKQYAGQNKLPALKGQALGPISLGLTLTDENKRSIFYNEQMQDAILKVCVGKAVWQARFLKSLAEHVVLFLDEPYLVSYGSAYVSLTREQIIDMLNEIIDKLHGHDVVTGVHCCGSTDWSILMDTNVDIINFDAYNYSNSMALYPKQLNKFLGQKKYLAWGIVPTAEDAIFSESAAGLCQKLLDRQKHLHSLGVHSTRLVSQTLITPACGTGSLSEAAAERVIGLLLGASELYKQKSAQDV